MTRIADAVPDLIAEIQRFLVGEGQNDIADQFDDLALSRWTYDATVDALYVYLTGQRSINAVEQNVIGTRHGECIEIRHCEGTVVLDTDNFNRVTGIEILNRKDIKKKLEKFGGGVK